MTPSRGRSLHVNVQSPTHSHPSTLQTRAGFMIELKQTVARLLGTPVAKTNNTTTLHKSSMMVLMFILIETIGISNIL